MRSFLVGCLACALSCMSCALESTDMSKNNNAPYSLDGKLEGWGVGGIINPPGTPNPNPKGQKTIHLQADLDPAAVFTVQFSTTPLNGADLTGNIPVAVIKFSVNGVTVIRKISVYDGAAISGPGQVCEVNAFDETQDPTHSAPYFVGVTVTRGTRGGFDIPTLQSDPNHTVNAGAQVNFFPEANTGAVMIRFDIGPTNIASNSDLTKFVAQFVDASGNVLAAVQNPTEWVPIPPGTVEIFFQNNDSVSAYVRMVLGIDG